MANRLEITTQYKDAAWIVTGKVAADSDVDFPREIFLWTLDAAGALEEFQAIGGIDQVARYPLYSSTRTSNFGVHLVRSATSTQTLSTEADVEKVKTVLKSAFTNLTAGYDSVIEPITEYYP